jgi:hypothetical protein
MPDTRLKKTKEKRGGEKRKRGESRRRKKKKRRKKESNFASKYQSTWIQVFMSSLKANYK